MKNIKGSRGHRLPGAAVTMALVGCCLALLVSSAGLAVAELSVTIPATTGDVMVGPFPPEQFNRAVGESTDPNKVYAGLDSVTGITVALIGF